MKTMKLIVGQAALQLKKLKSNSVDMILTSPPYDDLRAYNGYVFDFKTFRSMARQMLRVLKPGGVIVWVVGDATVNGSESLTSHKQALYFKETLGMLVHDTMIYQKSTPPLTKRRYEQAFEYMYVFGKGVPKTFNGLRVPKLYPESKPRVKQFGRNTNNSIDYGVINTSLTDKLDTNVWKINQRGFNLGHPAPFPEELARRHVHSWTNEGDVVLDPMCGSGTTGVESIRQGRKFIGIDISEEYIEITRRRLHALSEVPAPIQDSMPQSIDVH